MKAGLLLLVPVAALVLAGCTEADFADVQTSCAELEDFAKANCWQQKALASGDPALCDNIDTSEYGVVKNRCLAETAKQKGDYTACDRISDEAALKACRLEIGMKKRDVGACKDALSEVDWDCVNSLEQHIRAVGCRDELGKPDFTCVTSLGAITGDTGVCYEYYPLDAEVPARLHECELEVLDLGIRV
jgi:hypothetical protein